MAKIPESIKDVFIVKSLKDNLVGQGKVTDIYTINEVCNKDGKPSLLQVRTNRISIFDFVLSALIPHKGEVLTALTHFWLTHILTDIPNHLIGRAVNENRNYAEMLLDKYPDIDLKRSLLVENLDIAPYEMIFRGHLGGSIYPKYLKTGLVAGQKLPPNIPKWTKMDEPLFTPSTKEADGHDVNITAQEYIGNSFRSLIVNKLRKVYQKAYEYARSKGIIILDTKFEYGESKLADEVLTPDSSRFTSEADWLEAMAEKRDPIFLDKEPVRIWGGTISTPFLYEGTNRLITGINNLDPKNPEHVAFVHSLKVPDDVIMDTTERYLRIFHLLTGMSLNEYQLKHLL